MPSDYRIREDGMITSGVRWKCPACKRKFIDLESLDNHFDRKHPSLKEEIRKLPVKRMIEES